MNLELADSAANGLLVTHAPALSVPMFDLPTFDVPVWEMPSFGIPAINVPILSAPSFEMPTFDVPMFEMPTFVVPTFDIPTFDVPVFETPSIAVPVFEMPDISGVVAGLKELSGIVQANLGSIAGALAAMSRAISSAATQFSLVPRRLGQFFRRAYRRHGSEDLFAGPRLSALLRQEALCYERAQLVALRSRFRRANPVKMLRSLFPVEFTNGPNIFPTAFFATGLVDLN